MAAEWTTNREFAFPGGADGVITTPPATQWMWSDWEEIVNETEVAYCPTKIVPSVIPVADERFEVALGISDPAQAASTSVEIARLHGEQRDISAMKHGALTFARPVDLVPAGKRIAVRMRKEGTSTTDWRWAISALKKPIAGNLELTTKSLAVAPDGAAWINLSTTGATDLFGSPGAWTQILSSIPAGMILTHISNPRRVNGEDYYIEFGVGASPSVNGPSWRGNSGLGDGPHCMRLPNPYTGFAAFAGQALSARQWLNDIGRPAVIGICYEHD